MEQNNRLNLKDFSEKINLLRSATAQVVMGQDSAITLMLTAILSNGHILIEGVPGLAKTLLAKTIAHLIHADFRRLQFTPDLMPSDALGTNFYNMKTQEFHFHPGPVFTQMLLVDEINRAPAKTQAALFEVMEERQATIDGSRYTMDDFYFVLATQNPIEQEGTYRLPEAQLDRFLMKITMNYPPVEAELHMLEAYNTGKELHDMSRITPLLTRDDLLEMRKLLPQVVVDKSMMNYIIGLVGSTRRSPLVYLGASPRASIALLQTAKSYALLQGRDFVIPDDVKATAPAVLAHRISLTADAEMNGHTAEHLVTGLLDKVEIPQ